MTRRRFCTTAPLVGVALSVGGRIAMAQTTQNQSKAPDKGPRIAEDLVKEFVGAAHGNLARVEEMLQEHPKLINAVWDWGGGDYESALGAAGHMGRADIARFLLAHGAHFDLYAATMLGELEVVKAVLTARPDLAKLPGPHGIPLIAHAKAGGENAVTVLRYLESLS